MLKNCPKEVRKFLTKEELKVKNVKIIVEALIFYLMELKDG